MEVEKGIFIVDDTGIPDTPEQSVSRKLREEAAARAKAIASDPVLAAAAQAAQQAAQEAAWEQNKQKFAESLHAMIVVSNDTPTSYESWLESRNELLAASIPELQARDQANAERVADVSKQPDSQPVNLLEGDRKATLDSFEGDIPIYFAPQTFNAARTISTDRIWPGGGAGLSLLGSNTIVGMWDGGAARVTHQEFIPSGRVIQRDGSTNLDSHATAVTGVLAGYGLDFGGSIGRIVPGMAQAATVWAHDKEARLTEIPSEITNSLRLSNHSYGPGAGWEFDTDFNMWRWYGWTPYSQNEDWKLAACRT